VKYPNLNYKPFAYGKTRLMKTGKRWNRLPAFTAKLLLKIITYLKTFKSYEKKI